MAELDGRQGKTDLGGGYSIQAPGMRGKAVRLSRDDTRSLGTSKSERLDQALEEQQVRLQAAFEIEVDVDGYQPEPDEEVRARSLKTAYGEPAVRFKAPRPGADEEQAILYTDEAGYSRWILPEELQRIARAVEAAGDDETAVSEVVAREEAERGGDGDGLTYLLPQRSLAAQAGDGERGRISKIGRRVVRVLAWASGSLIGKGAKAIARLWENHSRKYGLYLLPDIAGAAEIDWESLKGQRSLLLIHGTFSSTAASFSNLDPSVLAFFRQKYGNRVLTFDHPSLHHSPVENVEELIKRIPDGAELDLDIICHSRGGLVARELALRAANYGIGNRKIRVNKIVLVAVPNRGTILTNGMHDIVMLDRFTNLIAELPDNQYTLWFEGIMAVLKLLLHGGLKGLPGLQSMLPDGPYQKDLNSATGPAGLQFYGVGADFQPTKGPLALFGRQGDKLLDEIFGEANDAVVPTDGAYKGADGAFGFPIGANDYVVFDAESQVHHCNYFSGDRLLPLLQRWL